MALIHPCNAHVACTYEYTRYLVRQGTSHSIDALVARRSLSLSLRSLAREEKPERTQRAAQSTPGLSGPKALQVLEERPMLSIFMHARKQPWRPLRSRKYHLQSRPWTPLCSARMPICSSLKHGKLVQLVSLLPNSHYVLDAEEIDKLFRTLPKQW